MFGSFFEQPRTQPPLRVLVVLGHPRNDSFCAALAAAYRDGAREAGACVHTVAVGDLRFDPDVRLPSPDEMPTEPDLARVRRLIEKSDHLVFVYPSWWGTMPARLKGLLDSVLTPGWAFRFHAGHRHWDQGLAGRTAELVTTMDTPPWVHRLINHRPGHYAMYRATLGFCGVKTVRETVCGPVATSTPDDRNRWLEGMRERGRCLSGGPWSPTQRLGRRTKAWLVSLRLQFYPMTWAAYTLGALLAPDFSPSVYWLGYGLLFLLEAATVWTNEVQDYDSDRRNRAFGPFNGGSRVLVTGALRATQLNRATVAVLCLAVVGAALLLTWVSQPLVSGLVLAGLAVLALGYTLPPLKLVYHGLGELDVAVTHSIGVILCGFVFQGGAWYTGAPWWLSLPLALAVLGGIALGNIPDIPADRATGKWTLPVRLTPAGAASLSVVAVVAAVACALWLPGLGPDTYGPFILLMPIHAAWLVWRLAVYIRHDPPPGRIDGLLVGAMSFILWFCVLPLLVL